MPPSPADDIHALYDGTGADVDLAGFLRSRPPCSPDQLADLIEADGRARLDRRLHVDLHRYIDAVPGLRSCEDALDAAIDMALRSLSGSGRPTDEAVRTLVARHPDLARDIADAAQLNLALGGFSTHPGGRAPGPLNPPFPTPCDFGPRDARGVPRYRLRRYLGAGASGIVYEAIDRALSEPDHEALIAIKVLRSQAAHPRVRDAFFEEATKVRRISHPAVVRIEDCGIAESGDPYLVYEFLPRGDLQHFLLSQPGPLQARRAAELVARIARGVHAAHSAGLIHCDLKPSNVLLDDAGFPKVGDFGVAIRLGQLNGHHSAEPGSPSPGSSRAGGNLAFMSPEQYRMDAAAVSTAADIYALGGLLYYLLTRTPPNGATPGEVELAHDPERGRRQAVSARAARSDVPADLDTVCRRALSPAPEERQESAAALADDLERWLNHQPIPWTRPSLFKVFGLWIRRRPVIAALVFALVTVALSGAATGASLWYLAVERKAQATKAEAQVSIEKIVRERIYAASNFMLATMAPDIVMETDTSILPETFYLEWVFGPTMLDTPEQLANLWSRRIKIAQSELAKLAAAAPASSDDLGPRDLRTLLWEFTLGLWLTKSGNPFEAEEVLKRNHQKWSEILPQDTKLLARIDAVRATAVARQLISAPQHDKDALRAAASDLDKHAQALYAASDRTIIHLLVLRTLEELFTILEDASSLDKVIKDLKPYENFGKPTAPPPKAGKRGSK